jgi:hypothetical protein
VGGESNDSRAAVRLPTQRHRTLSSALDNGCSALMAKMVAAQRLDCCASRSATTVRRVGDGVAPFPAATTFSCMSGASSPLRHIFATVAPYVPRLRRVNRPEIDMVTLTLRLAERGIGRPSNVRRVANNGPEALAR